MSIYISTYISYVYIYLSMYISCAYMNVHICTYESIQIALLKLPLEEPARVRSRVWGSRCAHASAAKLYPVGFSCMLSGLAMLQP